MSQSCSHIYIAQSKKQLVRNAALPDSGQHIKS